MNGLMIHAGANHVDENKLASVATPERTPSWVPVPHHTLLCGVRDSLTRAGLPIVSEAHALTGNGARYFGLMQVGDQGGEFSLVVGIRNSHDMAFAAGLCLGASVFVCDNLSFRGEVTLARKHTVNVARDLPMLIERAVGRLGDLRRSQEERFDTYRHIEIGDAQAHDLLIQAFDARILPVTKLPTALQEWRTPRHAEFAENGKTAWRLWNALTEALKGSLDQLPRRTTALHGLIDTACGLVASREPILAQAT